MVGTHESQAGRDGAGPRLARLLDAAVVAMAVLVVVAGTYMHADAEPSPGGLTLGVLAALALSARGRLPVWTVAMTSLFAALALLVDPVTGPYALVVPAAALFSVALTPPARLGGRASRTAAGVGAAGVAAAAQLVNAEPPALWASLQHPALLAAPILAAEVLRTRRSYRSVLLERVELLERTREQEAARRVQEERLRIARDLHDVVAHTLTTINVQAAVAGHLIDRQPERAHRALALIEETSRDAIAEVRGIVGVLRDGEVAPLTPAPGLDEVPALVEAACHSGLHARLDASGAPPGRVPDAVSRAAYRIVQESLTNAARHAPGADVRVGLAYDAHGMSIDVENTRGSGLAGMGERAQALGGTLSAGETEGGFAVAAHLPYGS